MRERVLGERINRLIEEADIADRLLGEFQINLSGTNTLYRRHLGLLGAFRRMARSLIGNNDVEHICKKVAESIADEVGVDHCSVLLVTEAGDELQLIAGASCREQTGPPEPPFRRFRLGEGVAGQVAASAETVLIGDVRNDARWAVLDIQVSVRSLLCLPLLGDGRQVLGVLNISHQETNFFTSEHVQVFEMLCPLVGQLIGFARLNTELRGLNRDLELDLRSLTENLPDALVRFDLALRTTYLNHQFARRLGIDTADALGRELGALPLEPASRDRLAAEARAACDDQVPRTLCLEIPSAKGSRHYEFRLVPEIAADGSTRSLLCISRDITEMVLLERQLRHSQKMEAVGTLAGGVAHDFNNLLTAILGWSSALLEQLPARDPLVEFVEPIVKAGENAASLTRQLLAFSRRQVVSPRVLDLNECVVSAERLLRRLLGERVRLNTCLAPSLTHVCADPGQMEQLIMNLAVNARDAMPEGGDLYIETCSCRLEETLPGDNASVPPGDYVVLVVRDTGNGMDAQTQSRVFEPFFTTKEVGKGTGLGLATVHGIVSQGGGHILLNSAIGKGTEFRIYLVRADDEAKGDHLKIASSLRMASATILLVEDEPHVREVLRHLLSSDGHNVLLAASGEEALRVAESCATKIDLLITDVVMPGMLGVELASALLEKRPQLRLLFMSGYTDQSAALQEFVERGASFLAKPFSNSALRERLIALLPRPHRS